jgi:integrase
MAVIERKASYAVRVWKGGQQTWIGSFNFSDYGGKKEAKRAAVQAELEARKTKRKTKETCDSFAKRWPDDYPIVKSGPTRGRMKSPKTIAIYRDELKVFIEQFKGIPLHEVDRSMARRFANAHPRSAHAVKAMFFDAHEDELVEPNPFAGLQMPASRGRSDYPAITEQELHDLADTALIEHGSYGSVYRAFILFTGYVGCRLMEGIHVEPRDIRFGDQEVDLRITKLDKPRTVLLLPGAADAIRSMPRRIGDTETVFYSKRGKRLTKGNHQSLWTPIRSAWWAKLSEARRTELIDFDWHSLRHFCAHHIYISLNMGAELTAYQLGHADPVLVQRRYGKPFQGALERMKTMTGGPTPLRVVQEAKENVG